MSSLAIIATLEIAAGKRSEYLEQLVTHRERCLSEEPGTLAFEILVPHDEADIIMLYEVYASEEAFEAHMTGDSISKVRQNTPGMLVSLSGIRCSPA